MALLTTFSLFLISLLPYTTAIEIATFDQAGSQRVPGYIGPNNVQAPGDQLINTFCYCAPREKGGNASHYYQTDYFSWHLWETMIISQACLSGHDCLPCHTRRLDKPTCDLVRARDCSTKPKSCLPINPSTSLLTGADQHHWERKWFRLSLKGLARGRVHDHLAYWPNWEGVWRDVIEFNGHKRDLSPSGGQGQKFVAKEEVERVCEKKCWEQVGSGVLKKEGEELSRQVYYTHLDDMCDGCK